MKLAFKIFLLCGILLAILFSFEIQDAQPDNFKYEVFEYGGGYGYDILRNKKVVIKQQYIPGLRAKQQFCNVEDAEKVARLVNTKLNYGSSPSVTFEEISDLGISIKCNQ